ncbi:MAG: OmpH family outer membrane protein [Halanaerobiales bacterium]
MKINRNKIITTVLLVILVISGAVFVYPVVNTGAESDLEGRIAYVDLWAVFNEHPRKDEAEEELNQLAQSMQMELEEEAQNLPEKEQQAILEEYQDELSQKEQELIQGIVDSIKDIIVKVAAEEEVRMVLDQKNVIYGGYDMTQGVIDYIENNPENTEIEEETTGEENTEESEE